MAFAGLEFPFGMRRVFWEWCLWLLNGPSAAGPCAFMWSVHAARSLWFLSEQPSGGGGTCDRDPVRRGKSLWQRIVPTGQPGRRIVYQLRREMVMARTPWEQDGTFLGGSS